ncbi:MAG: hypothetical protein JOZ88_03020 [Hyphomicrobiales bacterium]|nr:hypothetical protein [Hyphomicrobiales bacterium]
MSKKQLDRVKQKGIEEAKKFLWIFVYLFILLSLFAAHKAIILGENSYFYHGGFAIINAFVLAKVILIAGMFDWGSGLKEKPLIHVIVFNSAVFSVVLMSFHILEEMLGGMWHGKTAFASIPTFGSGGLESILVVGVIMFLVLMPFFALKEIGVQMGNNSLYELFFVRRIRYVPQNGTRPEDKTALQGNTVSMRNSMREDIP